MFRFPDAKRVRRESLQSSASSRDSTPDESLTKLFLARVQQEYEPSSPAAQTTALGDNEVKEQEEDELEFRLFANAQASDVQKIRVRTPTPAYQEPGFTQPCRPETYYFTGDTPESLKRQYENIALSGEDVLRYAKLSWPGCRLPWRVTKITSSGKVAAASASSNGADAENNEARQRKRAGKKKRIALRKKAADSQAKQRILSLTAAEKEAAEREKRTRKNREKKVKKKEKEKAKKAAIEIAAK